MMRRTAPVSVVIPAYNAQKTIGRTLDSVASQSLAPHEVIVVDDGSTDQTAEAAEACRDALAGIRLVVIRQENQGAGAARNRCIAEATQEYLAFLDADDEWLPGKLERSMQVITEGGFDLVAHDYFDATPDGDVHVDCASRYAAGPSAYSGLYIKGYIPSISVVTRRELVLDIGGFDETLRNAQDFELWLALLEDPARTFVVFGEALARYHFTPGSIMSHTERRIACCTVIARRYIPALKRHGVPVLPTLWRRMIVLYLEASRAQPTRRLWLAVRGATALLRATLWVFTGPGRAPERRLKGSP